MQEPSQAAPQNQRRRLFAPHPLAPYIQKLDPEPELTRQLSRRMFVQFSTIDLANQLRRQFCGTRTSDREIISRWNSKNRIFRLNIAKKLTHNISHRSVFAMINEYDLTLVLFLHHKIFTGDILPQNLADNCIKFLAKYRFVPEAIRQPK